jgi:DNA-binding transcriptional regulator/RsmH inhibitor MraZ
MNAAMRRIKLDKGRLRIPAAFRQALQGADSVWITNYLVDHEHCLVLCAPQEWGKLVAKFRRAFTQEERLFETFFIGGGEELAIDPQGRVRIPPRLLKFINNTPPFACLPRGEPRTVLLCRPEPRWLL